MLFVRLYVEDGAGITDGSTFVINLMTFFIAALWACGGIVAINRN